MRAFLKGANIQDFAKKWLIFWLFLKGMPSSPQTTTASHVVFGTSLGKGQSGFKACLIIQWTVVQKYLLFKGWF